MPEANPFELLALHRRDLAVERSAHGLTDAFRQSFGDDDGVAVHVIGRVVELGMERDRQVRRNRPWRGRPDQHRDVASGERRHTRRQIRGCVGVQRELDVDRRRRVILVLDLGFSQRRAAMDAPVHRLLALVDQATFDELAQRPCDVRLIPRVHRQVVVIPVAEHHQPLELGRHHVRVAAGVLAAGAADLGDRHVALLRPELAIDLELDRQAVAVVARQIGHVEARHRARLDDEVLQDLVEGRAEMDLPVGVGRTVVEDELRCPAALVANLPVQVHGLPARNGFRLGRLKAGLHRELGPGQIDGVLPLGHRCAVVPRVPALLRSRDRAARAIC